MTWKLWYALHHPLHTPLFQRVYQARTVPGRLRRILKVGLTYLLICGLLTLLWPLLITDLPLVLGLILFASNNLSGMIWADRVSLTLARENELATFDLLCLLPTGQFGAIWSLSTASLHDSHIFRGMGFLVRLVFTGVIGGLSISLLLSTLLVHHSNMDVLTLLVPLLYAITLALAFYLDYIQAVITATMVGMLAATYTTQRTYSRIMAVGTFLLFQVTIYLAVDYQLCGTHPLVTRHCSAIPGAAVKRADYAPGHFLSAA